MTGADIIDALGLVSATAVGAVVASSRPAHPVGWLLVAFGLLVVVSVAAIGYAGYAVAARPEALPAAGAAMVLVYALTAGPLSRCSALPCC